MLISLWLATLVPILKTPDNYAYTSNVRLEITVVDTKDVDKGPDLIFKLLNVTDKPIAAVPHFSVNSASIERSGEFLRQRPDPICDVRFPIVVDRGYTPKALADGVRTISAPHSSFSLRYSGMFCGYYMSPGSVYSAVGIATGASATTGDNRLIYAAFAPITIEL